MVELIYWVLVENGKNVSQQWGLNPRPSAYKADALPLSYTGLVISSLLLVVDKTIQILDWGTIIGAWFPIQVNKHDLINWNNTKDELDDWLKILSSSLTTSKISAQTHLIT